MKADEFVEKMKNMAPSSEYYVKKGLDEKFAVRDRNSFFAKEKRESTRYDDELLKLVDRYNASKLIIGQITFYSEVEEKSDYYLVGEVEADWLIINKISGEVKVIELYSEENLWPCATNGSDFLEAILTANMFFIKSRSDDDLFNDQGATCAVAEECAEQAGGKAYRDFYKMLLGCFE
jgi:hypothetical protein